MKLTIKQRADFKAELLQNSKEELIEFIFQLNDKFDELDDLNTRISKAAGVDVDKIEKEVNRRFNQ